MAFNGGYEINITNDSLAEFDEWCVEMVTSCHTHEERNKLYLRVTLGDVVKCRN